MAEDKNKLATQQPKGLPTIKELVELAGTDKEYADNNLAVLLNNPPPKDWVREHPIAKVELTKPDGTKYKIPLPYIPVERIEYMLTRIFTKWWVEVKDSKQVANAIMVTVRLYVINPLNGETMWNDGIGAVSIQTDSGAGASDWSKIKNNGVQLAAPAAESYAFKDAAEKFGNLFGKDISRKQQINYTDLLVKEEPITSESLKELYELKKESVLPDDQIRIEQIIKDGEKQQYRNVFKKLQAL